MRGINYSYAVAFFAPALEHTKRTDGHALAIALGAFALRLQRFWILGYPLFERQGFRFHIIIQRS